MIAKLCMVLIFIGVAVGVGIYCRRSTASVDGFVLGGRSVGPWMSAFAFGTSYFSAVSSSVTLVSSGGNMASPHSGRESPTRFSAACLLGGCSARAHAR